MLLAEKRTPSLRHGSLFHELSRQIEFEYQKAKRIASCPDITNDNTLISLTSQHTEQINSCSLCAEYQQNVATLRQQVMIFPSH